MGDARGRRPFRPEKEAETRAPQTPPRLNSIAETAMQNTAEMAEKCSAGRRTSSNGQRWSGVRPRVRGGALLGCSGGGHAQDLRCSHRPGVDWLD